MLSCPFFNMSPLICTPSLFLNLSPAHVCTVLPPMLFAIEFNGATNWNCTPSLHFHFCNTRYFLFFERILVGCKIFFFEMLVRIFVVRCLMIFELLVRMFIVGFLFISSKLPLENSSGLTTQKPHPSCSPECLVLGNCFPQMIYTIRLTK